MNKLILFLISFSFMTQISLGAKVDEKELNTFLEAVKEKEDEELLLGSEQFKDCETQLENFRKESSGETESVKNKELLEKCVAEKIMGDDSTEGADKKLLEIAKNLSLSSYNPEASKTSSSIREYLEKRIHKAIHGNDANTNNTKIKDLKLVNHDVYYQLYSEQIGKNTLLEVSRYCLENFGLHKPTDFLYYINKGTNKAPKIFWKNISKIKETQEFIDLKEDKDKFEYTKRYELNFEESQIPNTITKIEKEMMLNQVGFSFANAKEYQVCTLPNKEQCDKKFNEGKTDYRNLSEISLLKDLEFKLSSLDPEKKLIKSRYNFCAGSVLQNMCKIYKCNNTYDNSATPEIAKECKDSYGITLKDPLAEDAMAVDKMSLNTDETKGFIACNILGRLEEYRLVLKGIKVIKDDNAGNRVSSGMNYQEAGFKGVYDGRGGDIDKLTSIGSKDLISGVEEFKNAEENAKKLQEECLEGNSLDGWTLKEGAEENKKCSILLAKLDESKLGIIEIDTEAKTALKLKEVDQIENKKDLEEYLKANGLDKFVGKLEELEIDQLKTLIKDDFKSKRMALIDNLNQRFEQEKKLKTGEDIDEAAEIKVKNSIANQTIADVEVHKRRVETLFEYSNIVSSYLEVNDEEGNSVGSNITGRSIELESNKELKDNGYFSTDDQIGGSGDSLNYLSAIDQILKIDDPDEKKENTSP